MRIHHLNCVSSCPLGGALMDGISWSALRGRLTTHSLLVELDHTLVLVDTGYGLRDVRDPASRLSRFFLTINTPELRESMTAIRQIEALGFDPRDVRQIVLSHLDFDHAGGLDDFPHATVHLLGDEIRAATAQKTMLDRMRYRPQQWGETRKAWQAHHASAGEPWYGFDCVRELPGIGPDLLMVPLVGHTLGHAGIAVRRGDTWLLYAADAYFYHAEMDLLRPQCTPGLRAYQTMMEKDRTLRLLNQRRLRELRAHHGDAIEIFCTHDVHEFERLAGRAHDVPAGAEDRRIGTPVITAPSPAET
jgi:glyoxylase-like metal-dependent hydrolase (beta-lactamase superfamily II)